MERQIKNGRINEILVRFNITCFIGNPHGQIKVKPQFFLHLVKIALSLRHKALGMRREVKCKTKLYQDLRASLRTNRQKVIYSKESS